MKKSYSIAVEHIEILPKIIATVIIQNIANITTKVTQLYYSSIYEYHFVKQNNNWYLSQIFLIDEYGKYPSV